MWRELLSVGPVALAVADLLLQSSQAEMSARSVGAQTGNAITLHQSNTVTQRYRATRQALRLTVTGNITSSSATSQPHQSCGPSNTATRSCAVMLSYQRVQLTQRNIREHQYECIHRNEESAKQAAYCCSCRASGSSNTQPCAIVPLGHRSTLVWQDPEPERKHAISDQHEGANPQPQAAQTGWRQQLLSLWPKCSALWSVAVLHTQQTSPQLFQKEKLADFHRAVVLLRVQVVFFFLKD